MRATGLIAINFVREQRWPILVLMLWVVLLAILGLVLDLDKARNDVLFVFKQLGVYGVAFAVFFGASAIHNERKTRRILAVLSKGVSRPQYISGLLIGIAIAVTIFSVSMGVTGSWVLTTQSTQSIQIWGLILCLMLACVLSASVAVLFSTLLNPLFATLATAIVLGVPAVVSLHFGSPWGKAIPAYSLLDQLLQFSLATRKAMPWALMALAVFEAIILWLAASWIFSQRDVAVSVE
jgi:ABC-type transport system involved in multi-copper enzyme maturation permease subunit